MKRTTVFTCSVFPELTRVWFHFLRARIDAALVDVVIYDCGGRMRPEHFPGARVVRHPNHDHGRKVDHFTARATTPLVLLIDDDCFVVSERCEPFVAGEILSDEKAAALTLRPRGWWKWNLAGEEHLVMGSYAVAFRPAMVRERGLSFRVRPTQDPAIRRGSGYYDTGDWLNRQLLEEGLRVIVPEREVRDAHLQPLVAVSGGYMGLTRRALLSRRRRLREGGEALQRRVASDRSLFERSCGIAVALQLHRDLFGEESDPDGFPDLDGLASTIDRHASDDDRAHLEQLVDWGRTVLERLRALS